MRILHVIPSVAPRYGGPSYAVAGFCRALNARGVDTLIATTNADGAGDLPVEVGTPTRFHGLSTVFFRRRGEAFKYSADLARWLRQHIAGFDVVHIHAVFSHASLAAGRACRQQAVPYVVRPLGSLDPWSLAQRAWKKRLLLEMSGRALIHGAAAIHFTTDDERRLAAPVAGAVRGAVVAPGIDASYLTAPIVPVDQRQLRIVALSRIDRKKRLEILIEAFQRIAVEPEFAGWDLVIAGDGDRVYHAELKRLAAAGPAAGRVVFTGWIDGPEKQRLLCEASLFALPSHQENFGVGLLEAMACSLPAVISEAVNLSPSVREAEAGWIAESAEGGFEAVLRVAMRDDAGRASRAGAARTLASRFRWETAAEQLESLYRSVTRLPAGAVS